ncbi:ATP phosphoribosyltransferase regulatory subunit [Phenylobacterium sp.]|uniref:ATP phosphoribosyltransferase regulatory subunit n=1 Tax=Phenylobacterium sp. TaxID=1871053 RepID=UPI0019A11FC5|nr:ATP phosphoribosyltransferase regulatory subunit [Phenylobacterium sp.]MBC7167358.1 ATP phosphoribosyltransferase regulatory subunit [Phenylobacterium sp.]
MRVEPAIPAEVLAAVRAPFDAADAAPVDVPLVQPLNLVLDLVGEALRARLFIVQAEGGPEFCLRPDFTAPVARRHLEGGTASGRYFYQGKAFRSAADHPGRPEEFLQIGLERFEDAEAPMLEAEVETLALAWASAKAGGRGDLSLWLGDAGLFAAFVESLDLAPALASRLVRIVGRPRLLRSELARAGQAAEAAAEGGLADLLADLPSEAASSLLREVWQLAGIAPVGGRGPGEIAERLVRKAEARRAPALTREQAASVAGFLAVEAAPQAAFEAIENLAGPNNGALKAALSGWQDRLGRLLAAGVPSEPLRFAAGLGHAFDYYDGLSFEVRSAALGPERPVAAGGRYDGLLARLGGPERGRAVGCMVRPWRAFAQGEA